MPWLYRACVRGGGNLPWLPHMDADGPVCHGQDCICASACALIWMGGVNREGTVGLHRPRIVDPIYKGLMPANASTAYNRLLASVNTYLDELEVPKPIIETMTATSSGEIVWADGATNQLKSPPSIAEWTDASCGPDVNVDWSNPSGFSVEQQMGKSTNHDLCAYRLYASSRGRLAPP